MATCRTKILMMFDDGVPCGPEIESINREYAVSRGYRFVAYHHLPDPNYHIYWNKIRVVQQELGTCDALWWVDADAFFLRTDESLPVINRDIAVSEDWNGMCVGVFGVKNNSWVHRFLDAWLMMGPVPKDRIKAEFDNDQNNEQTALKCLCYFFPQIAVHIERVSDQIIQNPTAEFNPDALMIHMWNRYVGPEGAKATVANFKKQGYTKTMLQHPPK